MLSSLEIGLGNTWPLMDNMNLMVYALGIEASTRYFDVLHLLFEHFMSIIAMSDFCLPLLHLAREDDLAGLDTWLDLEFIPWCE